MRLKLTLSRSGGSTVDLVSTVDGTATVADFAEFLAHADPAAKRQTPSLGNTALSVAIVDTRGQRTALPRQTQLSSSGLHSGATIALCPAGNTFVDGPAAVPVAVVQVSEGPDAGQEFMLARGTSILGRGRGCDVRLSDPLVSRQHAKINVTDFVEIVDLGSSNGVVVGEGVSARAVLRPGDTVRVGDTVMSIRMLAGVVGDVAHDASIAFNRSPRLDPYFDGGEFAAPEPPARSQHSRFPLIPMVAPLFLGVILYLVTHSLTSIIFVALSPVLMVGNAVESRIEGKKAFKVALAGFRKDLASLVEELRAAAATEIERCDREHPSTAACVEAARRLQDLIWTRRPDHRGFLELRLGLGKQASRNTIELPTSQNAPRALWQEVVEATKPFQAVEPVPVVGRLRESALGVAGPRDAALAVARAFVVQLVGLHSPAEVVLAGFASAQSARAWDWLKWLPHTSSPQSPLTSRMLASNATGGAALASELEELIVSRTNDSDDDVLLPAIAVLVEDDAPVDRARLVSIAEHGPAAGIFVIWVSQNRQGLPAACQTYVDVAPEGTEGSIGFVHSGEEVAPVRLEVLDADVALEIARRLSPLTDSGAPVDEASDLPSSVALLNLIGREVASSEDAVLERWVETSSILTGPRARPPRVHRAGTLRAVLGSSAGEKHVLDLRSQGPHALVGGTTGSGKSELLQSWILAMAAAHSPQRVTFLLVDYKGGSAFRDCVNLPHTIGLVTDLSTHLVRRALTSLSAELRYREHILAAKRAKDLVELERRGDAEAPPSLVIVVDEFAALVQEVPEFVDGVVNVAQRGRSLGLHLILATQRPAGVIKDNLRANTNLRVALRMADEGDSTDVLGTPLAASFDPSIPGRAASKTGPGRLVPFQAAYAGGWTTDAPPRPQLSAEELVFGAGAGWELPEDPAAATAADLGPTDIERLVEAIRLASDVAEIPRPRKPWLPELAQVYDLVGLSNRHRDDELVFAVADDPERQAQPVVSFFPDRDGNLAVYGTGGSGKSTLLRSLAISAGLSARRSLCHVYALDFGARGLHMLEALPHVGSVVPGSDHERVTRLIDWLRGLIDDRAMRYAKVSASTITEYRLKANAPGEPRILLLVDGIAAFRQAYEASDRVRWFDTFTSIVTDGRPVGVHVILSSDQRGGLSTALASAVQRRVVLRQASADEYGYLNVPLDVLSLHSPAGRGLIEETEIQVAVLGGKSDVSAQADAVRRLAEAMNRAGTSVAQPIGALPERVLIGELPPDIAGRPVIGLSSLTLKPVSIEPRGAFIVSGPPGSGRTSALMALAVALRRSNPAMRLHYFGSRRSPLAEAAIWDSTVVRSQEVADRALEMTTQLLQRSDDEPLPALFFENIAELAASAENELAELVRACLAEDAFVVAEGETSTLTSSYGLMGHLKSSRAGLALQPDQGDGTTVFRTNFPRINRAEFVPGRALLVALGRTEVVQVALATTPIVG